MNDLDESADHIELVRNGLEIHEERRYADALPYFEAAHRAAPGCPLAAFNIGNSLYMLDRPTEARNILVPLHEQSDRRLAAGCDELGSVDEFRTDLAYLLFLVTMDVTDSWEEAHPFLYAHLEARAAGHDSIYEWGDVCEDAEGCRAQYAADDHRLAALIRAASGDG